ncbi:interleukin-7 receptor subunit alpha [Dunckerocampus dactyliophorus]|uniref:interleukin-7 receptor subunit alpha n=1 Tax=Dunckerocampus dactyliophorus TaxID=161453 RepID=UPI00240706D4|nr:interleukin-7 receptor subunit alpha [Dunckerocampus dactyliophorus]
MLFVCWMAQLLLLLLLPAASLAQSGDGGADLVSESRISCMSHISTTESSLTCKLIGSRNEDDEDEDDGVESMTVCFYQNPQVDRCLPVPGDTITSADLNPLARLKLTIHLRRGGTVTKSIQMNKIVKPRSPEVWNVTVNHESNQAVFHIRTPYQKEYLKIENQLFQLVIWTSDKMMVTIHRSCGVHVHHEIKECQTLFLQIENVSSSDTMTVNMEHLLKNSKYHVKVRAMPLRSLQGSWSEWSYAFNFSIPDVHSQRDYAEEMMKRLIVCFIPWAVLTLGFLFFWKKIFPYIWPNILHPKPTLVQNCKTNKSSLLLNLKPEEFSALKIYPPVEKNEQEPDMLIRPAANHPCSHQSSDDSANTEELELSIQLNSSSSDEASSLQSSRSLLEEDAAPNQGCSSGRSTPYVIGVNQKEEDYVTMSSFYQIK